MSDIVNQLFASVPRDRLATFSCGHIIPESNLQTLVLRKGPRGGELQFKYQQRGDESLVRSTTLLDLCGHVRLSRSDVRNTRRSRSSDKYCSTSQISYRAAW